MSKRDIAAKILALSIHDINRNISVKDAEEHIKKHGDNAKDFFGANGEGLNEYISFIETFDKDKYLKRMNKKRG